MSQSDLTSQQQAIMKLALELAVKISGSSTAVLGQVDLGAQIQTLRDGVVPSARLKMATNPSNNDTVTIAGHVFKFVTALSTVAAPTQIQIAGSANASRALLISAINGVADANILPGTTSFAQVAAAGGWAVAADDVGSNVMRLRQVQTGYMGLVNYAAPMVPASITLAKSFTAGADVWNCANLNESGQAPGKRYISSEITITATMITNGSFVIDLPFTPDVKSLHWDGYVSGVNRMVNEAVVANATTNTITLTLAGGASPNWQAGDVFVFRISE